MAMAAAVAQQQQQFMLMGRVGLQGYAQTPQQLSQGQGQSVDISDGTQEGAASAAFVPTTSPAAPALAADSAVGAVAAQPAVHNQVL